MLKMEQINMKKNNFSKTTKFIVITIQRLSKLWILIRLMIAISIGKYN